MTDLVFKSALEQGRLLQTGKISSRDLLEACLKTCSNRDRGMLQSHLRVAERLLATFN